VPRPLTSMCAWSSSDPRNSNRMIVRG
jgi:hypothetical protein